MKLETLLNEYEKLVKSATSTPTSKSIREARERRTLSVYRFLLNCGVDRNELEKIEKKYNF